MKNRIIMLALLGASILTSCGYSSKNNELAGQVKKIHNNTPIFCSDYVTVDVSMGVMRNGVGSMSKEDVELTVADSSLVAILNQAVKDGSIVNLAYDDRRVTWCTENKIVTKVEVLKVDPK